MIFLYFLLIFIIIAGSYFCYYAWKFYNPYKLYMFFGKKGSGKSTLITKLGMQHSKKGWTCYSTEHTPGCYYLPPEKFGKVKLPKHSVIFVDEVGLLWHSRDFSKFPVYLREYFKLHRHYGHKIYLFSQAFDIDKTIRLLCDYLFIVECHFSVLSIARRINRKLVVVEPTGESESRIADCLQLQPLLFAFFGTAIFTWIPKWAPYFDSFSDTQSDWEFEECEYNPLPDVQRADLYYIKNKVLKTLFRRIKKKRRKKK